MKIKTIKRIMRPAKFWIDGIIYDFEKGVDNSKYFQTETNEGKISTKFRLPTAYYDKIHYDSKFKLTNIKKADSTEILLPKKGSSGDVTITGDSLKDVIETREDFHTLLLKIRQIISPRQFIAIPTLSQEVTDNFNTFKTNLLSKEHPIEHLQESIFQRAEKLHITVCVFALLDQAEIDEGIKLLHEMKETIIMPFFNGKQPKIKLKGISCMDTNIKKTNVLYANASLVDEDTEGYDLQSIGNKMAEFFYNKGFMKELRDSVDVKIHVTLINTKYRKESKSAKPKKRSKWTKRIPIDATSILDEYKDFDFGICNFDTVHLSLMSHGNSKSEDGFYVPLSIARLS